MERQRGVSLGLVVGFYCFVGGLGCLASFLAFGHGVFFSVGEGWELWKRIVLGLGVGGVVLGVDRLAEKLFGAYRKITQHYVQFLGGISAVQALVLAAMSSVAEEMLFRGFALPWMGLVWSSLIFGALHWMGWRENRWLVPVIAGVMGAVLGWVTLVSGDILAAILAHFTVNASNLVRLSRGKVQD